MVASRRKRRWALPWLGGVAILASCLLWLCLKGAVNDPSPSQTPETNKRPATDAPAQILRDDTASPPPPVVCIDPGHPSETNPGNALQNGLREVEIVWAVALLLEKELKNRALGVVMTKGSVHELVTNRRRAEIANGAGAALFIRLHCDTGPGRGIAFYAPDRQGTKYGTTGPSADVISESTRAADVIHTTVTKKLCPPLKDNGVKGDSATYIGARQGALTGSIFSRCPVVTVEMVFLSNPEDANWIKQEKNKRLVATALADGICAYVACDNPTEAGKRDDGVSQSDRRE